MRYLIKPRRQSRLGRLVNPEVNQHFLTWLALLVAVRAHQLEVRPAPSALHPPDVDAALPLVVTVDSYYSITSFGAGASSLEIFPRLKRGIGCVNGGETVTRQPRSSQGQRGELRGHSGI